MSTPEITAWQAKLLELIDTRMGATAAVLAHWAARPEFHRPPGPIKLQAKHIPDERFLAIVGRINRRNRWAQRWDGEFAALMMPPKVISAKAAALIRRGLLDGCAPHDCRGDYEVTPAGWRFLADAGVDLSG